MSTYKGTAKAPGDRLANVRGEDGNLPAQVKQTVSGDATSSEGEESSSEEESEDENNAMPVKHISEVSPSLFELGYYLAILGTSVM